MRAIGYAAAVLALSATLTACGATAEETPQQPPRSPSIAEQQQVVGVAPTQGYGISVPKIEMRSSLIPLGLSADGTVQVPPLSDVAQAGYYQDVKPGELGPAGIYCHINGGGVDGCGARFNELREGDRIDVTTPQGRVQFDVYRVVQIDKAKFPTKDVYSDVETPELRLITCGGNLDSSGHNYRQNVIVFAKKV